MWWIKNAQVIDPAQNISDIRDVLIGEGKILELKQGITEAEAKAKSGGTEWQEIEAGGCYLFPGLIDVHTHLREPGREDKEDIASGSRAAVRGGFTTILAMPNTTPVLDQKALIEYVVNQGEKVGLARIHPIAAITKGQEGKELVEMAELAAAGAMGFSDDGRGVQRGEMMRLALEYAKLTSCPVISHCEDESLAHKGVMHRGIVSTRLGLRGIPSSSESVMVARDLLLAEESRGKLHLAHISAKESVDLIREAKKRGVDVSAEVNPHHLLYTDEAIARTPYSTSYKVNPPLRTEEDRQALIEGLLDGTIDMLATDHAPHTWEEKTNPFDEAPFGISGLETALAATWQEMVITGILPQELLIKAWSMNPAQRFNLSGGTLKVGAPADLILFDPEHTELIDTDYLASKGKNTPFLGQRLKGFPIKVWVDGCLVHEI
ncbi:dihydroorotase [Desulfitobacterium dehalogenans ATCC 51507]|uniref:Dihydroorotase n=1 Tax=Desulfitobacterium dehalogenans (strain ATCC 51507 / DSM 9161 / JW/IU-DC1) TaxID=756499 RepID=I4ACI9_DESDJ|nr:dihydroorotase [Desulfitobacterium dehalogenans]AFM01674.1 dihydroorotase [Desulfitobacterium dehalogenans ATCC 51507]